MKPNTTGAQPEKLSLSGKITVFAIFMGLVFGACHLIFIALWLLESWRCSSTSAVMGLTGEVRWGLVCYVDVGGRWVPKGQVVFDLNSGTIRSK